MCGRYFLLVETEAVAALLQATAQGEVAGFPPRYNLAPSQAAPIALQTEDAGRILLLGRWGLPPASALAPPSRLLVNARVETAARKPSFAAAFRARRCLVPASGYYEWRTEAGARQPYAIRDTDDATLLLAGLWSPAPPEGGGPRFALLTTAARGPVAEIHDRMPVILPPGAWPAWLDSSAPAPDVSRLIANATFAHLRFERADPRVNKVANDDPALLTPPPPPLTLL